METYIKLYSSYENEIFSFLKAFYSFNFDKDYLQVNSHTLDWKKTYSNPIEITDIIAAFIENNDDYRINMWICLDQNVLINITKDNADQIIRYLFERYPY